MRSILTTCICLSGCILSGIGLLAQSNVLTAGGDASSAAGSVSYSIGQVDYTSAGSAAGFLSQGVQQPYELFAVGVLNYSDAWLSAVCFPNPTRFSVVLALSEMPEPGTRIELFDEAGRLISSDALTSVRTHIPMESLSAGTYFLLLHKHLGLQQTFRIIKQN
jgi:hypothetical protein